MLNVIVSGSGRMGSEILASLGREADLTPVGVIEKFSTEKTISLPDGSGSVPLSSDPDEMFSRVPADVVIDFTNADWTPVVAMAALKHGVRPVIGTSGLSDGFIADLEYECRTKGVGAFIAPNFRSEEHTSELQSHSDLVCRLLLEKKKQKIKKSQVD